MSSPEPKSPLTIIAIFAGIIEASALASLPFLGESSQSIYTWFLVGFPPFLTLLFFLTLNFNTKSLYGPDEQQSENAECDSPASAERPSSIPPLTLPYGSSMQANESTVTLSGAETQTLREVLAGHAMRHSTNGRLVLLDMNNGVRTTITHETPHGHSPSFNP